MMTTDVDSEMGQFDRYDLLSHLAINLVKILKNYKNVGNDNLQ